MMFAIDFHMLHSMSNVCQASPFINFSEFSWPKKNPFPYACIQHCSAWWNWLAFTHQKTLRCLSQHLLISQGWFFLN